MNNLCMRVCCVFIYVYMPVSVLSIKDYDNYMYKALHYRFLKYSFTNNQCSKLSARKRCKDRTQTFYFAPTIEIYLNNIKIFKSAKSNRNSIARLLFWNLIWRGNLKKNVKMNPSPELKDGVKLAFVTRWRNEIGALQL